MRRFCDWSFRNLSISPTILLYTLVCCAPLVFGQTVSPSTSQAEGYPEQEIKGFRAYFASIVHIESSADGLNAQGKDDTKLRKEIQKDAHLTDQETISLKRIAQQCAADNAAQTALSFNAARNLRQQNPPVPGVPRPPEITQQLTALEAQRSAVIVGCIQQLRTEMGTARFRLLELHVLTRVASKLQHGSFPPGTPGVTAPK